jgi:hypothetical protein
LLMTTLWMPTFEAEALRAPSPALSMLPLSV